MVLVNPNTSAAATRMMTGIARRALAGTGLRVRGVTVAAGPPMLTDPAALSAAVPHVLAAARRALAAGDCAALIVAAFGDPGVPELREDRGPLGAPGRASGPEHVPVLVPVPVVPVSAFGDPGVPELREDPGPLGAPGRASGPEHVPVLVPVPVVPVSVPVVGIGEAALAEAAAGGRRFGIATTTPLLAASIDTLVTRLGLTARYTGARFTAGAPERLSGHPAVLLAALETAARACVVRDGAEVVVIGGGPLGDAAEALRSRLTVPVVAPVPAACRRIARALGRA
ncbi:aspartate/glutamate racemase family protein [Streptomyces sp. NPDC014779]|uniref:aspartate/glutamate racemase family protein n=1 Tax=Streptomyces sp. NPDC014779 TaxID=3364911 RepID=UPI0036F6CE18